MHPSSLRLLPLYFAHICSLVVCHLESSSVFLSSKFKFRNRDQYEDWKHCRNLEFTSVPMMPSERNGCYMYRLL
jgi:hypothetical protein